MQCLMFHLMPCPHLPSDFDDTAKYPSAAVTFSNSHFDPERGNQLYSHYLDELEYAEGLGFDGVCVNEHHQTTYGLMPAPNLMAAAIVRRTKRVKILMRLKFRFGVPSQAIRSWQAAESLGTGGL